jgi:hypothetical protein
MTIIYKYQSLINCIINCTNNKVILSFLSINPNAIHFLKQNPDKINWIYLSKNTHIDAIHLL